MKDKFKRAKDTLRTAALRDFKTFALDPIRVHELCAGDQPLNCFEQLKKGQAPSLAYFDSDLTDAIEAAILEVAAADAGVDRD